jgi:ribosomal protein L1
MSKLSMDGLRGKIALMLKERKERKFLETVELQINLKVFNESFSGIN